MSEEEFKDEARGWDVTEDVFDEGLWSEKANPALDPTLALTASDRAGIFMQF